MKKIAILFLSLLCLSAKAQTRILKFGEAKSDGISSETLDKLYKSAVHSDPKLAVFKSEKEQRELQNAYAAFFRDFGTYLRAHDFKWEARTRCFNRIYMEKDGTVDFFLFDFGKNPLPQEKETQFLELLSGFLKTHKFPIGAPEKFAQCSAIVYE